MPDESSHAPSTETAAEAAAAAALASILRTSCTIIDMGSFLLNEVRSRPYTTDDAALACIAGEHVRQILPEALVERAAGFPPFDRLRQACYNCLAFNIKTASGSLQCTSLLCNIYTQLPAVKGELG